MEINFTGLSREVLVGRVARSILSYQKSLFWYLFEGLGMEILIYFMAIWCLL
jgi:hypothetical protein